MTAPTQFRDSYRNARLYALTPSVCSAALLATAMALRARTGRRRGPPCRAPLVAAAVAYEWTFVWEDGDASNQVGAARERPPSPALAAADVPAPCLPVVVVPGRAAKLPTARRVWYTMVSGNRCVSQCEIVRAKLPPCFICVVRFGWPKQKAPIFCSSQAVITIAIKSFVRASLFI